MIFGHDFVLTRIEKRDKSEDAQIQVRQPLLEKTTVSDWSIICLVRTVLCGGYGFQGTVTVPLAWEV